MASNHLPRALLLAAVASLALAVPANAAAPTFQEDDDKFVLDNGHVTVWFQGKKPMLKLMPSVAADALAPLPEASAQAGWTYKFTEVVEYRDLDADGAPDANEIVARLNLEKASQWQVERVETDSMVVLNLSLVAPVKIARNAPDGILDNLTLPAEGEADLSLVFTLRGGDEVLDVDGVNVSIPATSIKYDLVLREWPFVDAQNDRLALVSLMEGEFEVEGVEAVGEASVATNGTQVGSFSWLTTAQGVTASGEEVEVPVLTDARAEGNATTRIAFTYDAPDLASLVHDPTLGVMSIATITGAGTADGAAGLKDVPAPGAGAALGVGVVAAAAYGMRRRFG